MRKNKALITPLGLVGITVFSGVFLMSSYSFATDNTDVVDQINITIPVSCTLTGTNLLHSDTIQNDQYKTDIGSATIKATCNDTNGLAVYAIGYTNETDGNNKMHSSALDPSYDIVTGKYVSGTTVDSVWSMKLTPVSGTYAPTIRNDASYNYTNYELIPSTYTKVAYRTTATDTGTGSTGANFTTDYAVYASATQPAGTYTGKVKFTIVHPQDEVPFSPHEIECEANKICYNANADVAEVEGTMGQQVADNEGNTLTNGSVVTLLASNYSRYNYGFAGWNDAYDYSGNFYGPNQTITTSNDMDNNGLSLYAVWVKTQGSFQDETKVSTLCGDGDNSLELATPNGEANLASVSALTDSRDNQTYAIAKLADGNCWMIENLRLESENTIGDDNKNLAEGYGESAVHGNFIGLAEAESSHFGSMTANSIYYSGTQSGNASIDIGTTNDPSLRMPRYNNLNTAIRTNSPVSGVFPDDNKTPGIYSYGNYYSWAAAIADTAYYTSGDLNTTSICPTGWKIPRGNKNVYNKGYGALSVALGGPSGGNGATPISIPTGAEMSNIFRSFPNNFLYSGEFESQINISYGRGTRGGYWSISLYNTSNAYLLYIGDTFVQPGTTYFGKSGGYSIRCVKK